MASVTLCVCVCVCVCVCESLSPVQLFATPWTEARQAPLSMESLGKSTGVGCLIASPGDLPDPGIKLRSPALPMDSLTSEPSNLYPLNRAASTKELTPPWSHRL